MIEKFYITLSKVQDLILTYSLDSLTAREIFIISTLGLNNLTMTEFAIELGMSPTACAMSTKRMVTKGFLKKKKSLEDKRQVTVFLSDKGISVYEAYNELNEKIINESVEGISGENLDNFCKIMYKLNRELGLQQNLIKSGFKKIKSPLHK